MNDREHLSDDAIRRAFYVRKSRVSKQWTWSCRRLQISHAHAAGSASSQDTCTVVWLIGWYKQGSASEADYISQPRTFVYNHETSTTDNGRLTTLHLRFRFLYDWMYQVHSADGRIFYFLFSPFLYILSSPGVPFVPCSIPELPSSPIPFILPLPSHSLLSLVPYECHPLLF